MTNKLETGELASEAIMGPLPAVVVFEDDYRVVFKELGTISEYGKKPEKRVQIIQWKKVSSQQLCFDIRYYDTAKKIYTKGISLNAYELKQLLNILEQFNLHELD